MAHSAGVLVRERGVHGVGLREIVAHAGGPRGSLQRYFPGGKTQLIAEALDIGRGRAVNDRTSAGDTEQHLHLQGAFGAVLRDDLRGERRGGSSPPDDLDSQLR
jgi:AcrR family transcriptional regulator